MSTLTKINHHDFSDSVLLSAKFLSVCAVPCLFWSGPEGWPMSERESSSIVGHIDGINNTNLFVLQITPCDCHSTSTWRWFFLCPVLVYTSFHSSFFGTSARICNVVNSGKILPLEFHWFSIDSIQFSVLVGTLESHLVYFPIQH